MATLAPIQHCLVCGERLEFEVDPDRPGRPGIFAPTNYRAKPHTCPPGAAKRWRDSLPQWPSKSPLVKVKNG